MSTAGCQEDTRSSLQPITQALRLDYQGVSATQRSTIEIFDSALRLSVLVVKSLNTAVYHKEKSVLKELLAGISNISGLLFLLKQMLQDATSRSS